MIDWCLMPTLAIFQLYHGVNKFYLLTYAGNMEVGIVNEQPSMSNAVILVVGQTLLPWSSYSSHISIFILYIYCILELVLL